MASNSKVTKRERFAEIRPIIVDVFGEDSGQVAFIDHEVELLTKKRAGKSGLSSDQKANLDLQAAIASEMADMDAPAKATPIGASVGVGVQKATAMLTKMVEAGIVHREAKGKDTLFSLVAATE